MNILEKICIAKSEEISYLKKSVNYKKKIKLTKRRKFLKNLIKIKKKRFNLIAEIKNLRQVKVKYAKNSIY